MWAKWLACGMALAAPLASAEEITLQLPSRPRVPALPAVRDPAAPKDEIDYSVRVAEPEYLGCRPCDALVSTAESALGFQLGRRAYPDRSIVDAGRALPRSELDPNWGDVFQERGGAVKFLNNRRTAAVQLWGDVVPANDAQSEMARRASGRDAPPGVLVVGAGVRVGF
jgi:hypothetical protein